MCLVSYVPTNEVGYILSSNRDEAPARSALQIQEETINGHHILFPQDPAGGSWIFVSDLGTTLCLLNGAFTIHERHLPYRMSRGQMLKSYFEYASTVEFLKTFNFWNIEPFTMIIAEKNDLTEFRWDGQVKYIEKKDIHSSAVWSSCTLYSEEAQNMRASYFHEKIKKIASCDVETMASIQLSHGPMNTENAFVMNRNEIVKTISLSQIHLKSASIEFHHLNLLNNEKHSRVLNLSREAD